MTHTYKTWIDGWDDGPEDATEVRGDSPSDAATNRALDEFDLENPQIGDSTKFIVRVDLEAIAAAAADLVAYEHRGAPDYLHWEEKFEAMAEALRRLEADQ